MTRLIEGFFVRNRKRLWIGCWLAGLCCAAVGVAQQTPITTSTTTPATTQATTQAVSDATTDAEAGDALPVLPPLPAAAEVEADVPTDELELIVKPLTTQELEPAIQQWLARLEAKQRQISSARLMAARTEGDRRDQYLATAAQLELERGRLAERAEIVIDAYELKGGEASTYRQYVTAVTGADIDPSDVGAWMTSFQIWLLSRDGGVEVLFNVVQFLVIVILAWVLARILAAIARRALGRVRGASTLLREFLVGLVRKTVLLVGVIVAISYLGVDITPLLAAIGAAGLVIGLALQGTLSNFASGILILLYRPYDVGSVITAAGVTGKVQAMTLVSTTILSFDNQKITVPNNSIWNDVITNITGNDIRRVDMAFGIGYGDDIDKAQAILTEIVEQHPLVLDDPEPTIRVNELADSSVNFVVWPWAKTDDWGTVRWDIIRSVKQRFDAEGISIPFPQRDVHLYRA